MQRWGSRGHCPGCCRSAPRSGRSGSPRSLQWQVRTAPDTITGYDWGHFCRSVLWGRVSSEVGCAAFIPILLQSPPRAHISTGGIQRGPAGHSAAATTLRPPKPPQGIESEPHQWAPGGRAPRCGRPHCPGCRWPQSPQTAPGRRKCSPGCCRAAIQRSFGFGRAFSTSAHWPCDHRCCHPLLIADASLMRMSG